jgi:capsular exopolysaccharide synthesis family protein
VATLTAARLPGTTQSQVLSQVSTNGMGQSDLVSIQATSESPPFAAKLANTYATTYIGFRRDADRAKIRSAEAPLRQQIAALSPSERGGTLEQSLQSRLGQLNVLASLQTGNAELVQPAQVPTGPSSPKTMRNGAFGLFFGMLLAIALVILAEVFDRRLRDPADVESILDHPVVGAVRAQALGNVGARARSASNGVPPLAAPDQESFRVLRQNVRYFAPDPLRTVVVTSAMSQEGKSTVAACLAAATAAAGHRTLLVECDLRRPVLAARLGLPEGPGVSDYVTGNAKSHDIVRSVPAMRAGINGTNGAESSVMYGDEHRLVCITAGTQAPRPAELLASERFREFLGEVGDVYESVILDSPPLLTVADTLEIIPAVAGILLCVRLRRTTRDQARAAQAALERLPSRPLGLVLTDVRAATPGYYGYYGDYSVPAAAAR